jgi:hypothetical protein
MTTFLKVQALDRGISAKWRPELCGASDRDVVLDPHEFRDIDVSDLAGALLTIRNEGLWPFETWTDY